MFQVGLEDYYGHISTAFAAGTCQIMSPSAELLLPEGGRISAVQSGVASFSQFQVSGVHFCLLYGCMLGMSTQPA